MKSIFILGLLAIVGCSQTNQDLNQTSTDTETTNATKNTSQVQEALAPILANISIPKYLHQAPTSINM